MSLTAPQLLAVSEAKTTPSSRGFADAYPGAKSDEEQGKQMGQSGNSAENGEANQGQKERRLPKTMRDLEIALNANFREIGSETEKNIATPRYQMENKTGLEVAVLAL